MDTNPMGTTTTQIGQLADPIITLGVGPDASMAGATASLCDATFYVPELLALADRSRTRRPALPDLG
jgi:hypothetical protein